MSKYESYADKVKEAISTAALKGITEACLLVEAQAKALTPVDTGLLRDSITHVAKVEGGELVGVVGTPTEYAEIIEYGTRYMKGQPYMLPAFRENKQNIENIIGELLKSGVGK